MLRRLGGTLALLVLVGLAYGVQVEREAQAQWPTPTATPTEVPVRLVGLGRPAEVEDWLVDRVDGSVWLSVTIRSRTVWDIVGAELVCTTDEGPQAIAFKPTRLGRGGLAVAEGAIEVEDWDYSCGIGGRLEQPAGAPTAAATSAPSATATDTPPVPTETAETPTEAPTSTRQASCCSCYLPLAEA